MKRLLLRLSALDADAENAVRVISFFDRLITAQADLATLVRSAAQLAECPAGVQSPAQGRSIQADGTGQLHAGDRVPASADTHELDDGTVVWVAGSGAAGALSGILLERFAIATAVLLDHPRPPRPELGDPALVELALSQSAGDAERARALHLLGVTPATPVRVLAVAGQPGRARDAVAALTSASPGARHAALGPLHAVMLPGPATGYAVTAGAGITIGASPQAPAITAPQLWRDARTAIRFATPRDPLIWAEQLGALTLLARLNVTDIGQAADVITLDQLAAEPHGPETLDILAALCSTRSLRQAAAAVHRHHSTIPAKLKHAETVLGFPLHTPDARFRLRLALTLRHLRDTGGQLQQTPSPGSAP